MNEELLQYIWMTGLFNGNGLKSTTGQDNNWGSALTDSSWCSSNVEKLPKRFQEAILTIAWGVLVSRRC
jgi:hypothetical protein